MTKVEGAGQGRHSEPLPPDVLKRAYYNQPVWKRIVVIGAGPAMNLLLAFVILFAVSLSLNEFNGQVGAVESGTPAAAHLQPGDKLLAVDGKSFPNLTQEARATHFINLVKQHRCAAQPPTDGCKAKQPVDLKIQRDGQVEHLSVTPFYDEQAKRMRLGFSYGTTSVGQSPPAAAGHAASEMWHVTTGTLGVFSKIFEPQQRKKIHGIVGISDVTQQAFSYGAAEALTLIAFISLSLAIINLFPFLPLDGGHIFWSLVEKVRGRPVPFRIMERASVDRLPAGDGPVRDRPLERHPRAEQRRAEYPLGAAGFCDLGVGLPRDGGEDRREGNRASRCARRTDGVRGVSADRRGPPRSGRDSDQGRRVQCTWGEYAERVRAIAAGLATLGVEKGDTVALMMVNRPEFHFADAAVMHLGGVPFSIYNTYTAAEIEHLLNDAGCAVAIVEQQYADKILAARDGADALEHVVVIDGDVPDGAMSTRRAHLARR